jgi:lysophospholipase L1-like esterase
MPSTVANPPPITLDALVSMLENPASPPELVGPYLRVKSSGGRPFCPEVTINAALILPEDAGVAASATRKAALLAIVNDLARDVRLKRYRRRMEAATAWRGRRLVAEGDSWFQYPFLLRDVVNQLDRDFAILCSAAAGDELAGMLVQDEVVTAVVAERPDGVLLSAGGNDLLGRITHVVEPADADRDGPFDVDAHLGARFEACLDGLVAAYGVFLERILAAADRRIPILCHSYDYAIPRPGGPWLGGPLAVACHITDPASQEAIVHAMVDRLHEQLSQLVAEPRFGGLVTLVDCRGVVGRDEWHDELHPTNEGYAKVARRFRESLAAALSAPPPAPTPSPPARPEVDERLMCAFELAMVHDGVTLLHELGRRMQTMADDAHGAARDLSYVPDSSADHVHPRLRAAGEVAMGDLYRVLLSLVQDRAAETMMRGAFDEGRSAVAAVLLSHVDRVPAIPPVAAPVAVALALRDIDLSSAASAASSLAVALDADVHA